MFHIISLFMQPETGTCSDTGQMLLQACWSRFQFIFFPAHVLFSSHGGTRRVDRKMANQPLRCRLTAFKLIVNTIMTHLDRVPTIILCNIGMHDNDDISVLHASSMTYVAMQPQHRHFFNSCVTKHIHRRVCTRHHRPSSATLPGSGMRILLA